MKTPQIVNQLLQKPMDRKQFLQHTAAMAMFVAGGGAIVQSVTKSLTRGQAVSKSAASDYGYGASVYGGRSVNNVARSAGS